MRYICTLLLSFVVLGASAQQIENTLRPNNIEPDDFFGQIEISVSELSQQADELFMELEIRMDRDVMNRRLGINIVPELKDGEGNTVTGAGLLINEQVRDKIYRRQLSFGNEYLIGNRPEIKCEVTTQADTIIHYTLRMPFEQWMGNALFDIHQILVSPTGKEQLYTLAGISKVRLHEPYVVQPAFSELTPAYQPKSMQTEGQAYLNFKVNRSQIIADYGRNPIELSRIDSTIVSVKDHSAVDITAVYVEGFASPEGAWKLNERLAQARAEALADYIRREYGFEADIIHVSSVAEDWEGLRARVETSDMERRNEVLDIIDSDLAPDRKEQRLRALDAATWDGILNVIFPTLRRVEYRVVYTVKDFTPDELRELVVLSPEMLSEKELFTLARSYVYGSPEWEDVYELMIRQYPDSPTAIINYSSMLLMRGELPIAKRHLNRVSDNQDAANNLGIYYLLTGDLDMAETYLRQAQSHGVSEAVQNLEQLQFKVNDIELIERFSR